MLASNISHCKSDASPNVCASSPFHDPHDTASLLLFLIDVSHYGAFTKSQFNVIFFLAYIVCLN